MRTVRHIACLAAAGAAAFASAPRAEAWVACHGSWGGYHGFCGVHNTYVAGGHWGGYYGHVGYYGHPYGYWGNSCGGAWAAGAAAGAITGLATGAAIANADRPQTVVVNPAPLYVDPAPVYVTPPPVYVAPAPLMNSIVMTLPVGAQSINVGGVQYYQAGATWYRPYFGSNGVYYEVVPTP